MRIGELLAFVQALDRVAPQPGRDQRLQDEPDASAVPRTPPPTWVTQADLPIVEVGATAEITVWGEEPVSPESLPAEVRQPNPSVDTLAYYLPFHISPANWGIYLRESGLLVVAGIVEGVSVTAVALTGVELARRLLMAHESLHFHAEVACARAEVVSKVRAYDAYFADDVATAHEEALANAAAFRVLRGASLTVASRVRTWMEHQGPGYRDFHHWLTPPRHVAGLRRSTQHMLKYQTPLPPLRSPAAEPAEFLFDAVRRFRAPVRILRDVGTATDLKPFPKAYGIRVLVHTGDHPPPHVHIEQPPGRPYSRYEWPTLQPLKGDPLLKGRGRKALVDYVRDHGADIHLRVRAVYPTVPPWGTPSEA